MGILENIIEFSSSVKHKNIDSNLGIIKIMYTNLNYCLTV